MVVNNPESPHSPRHSLIPQTDAQRRQEAQVRRRRLGDAYTAAVEGYPRGGSESVYALPARYSTTTARIDDPILAGTYAKIAELRRRLVASPNPNSADSKAAAKDLATLVGRLRPGQRRYLAQQMLARQQPEERAACGICWGTFEAEKTASGLPCGHAFHGPCIQVSPHGVVGTGTCNWNWSRE